MGEKTLKATKENDEYKMTCDKLLKQPPRHREACNQ